MTTQISVRLPEGLLDKVRVEAKVLDRTINNLITRIINEHYKVQELREEQK